MSKLKKGPNKKEHSEMGYANCGEDSQGRPIGYAHEAICDYPGCSAKIDRGMSYACGGDHGEDNFSCEKYFCHDHMQVVEFHPQDLPPKKPFGGKTYNQVKLLCLSCAEAYEATPNGKLIAEE